MDQDRLNGILHLIAMTKGLNYLLKKINLTDKNKLKMFLTVFLCSFTSSMVFKKQFSSTISIYIVIRFLVKLVNKTK